jgi:lipoate-protein ligase A
VGEVPGEYCPGAHTVNARGRVKVAGTAQRVIRGAWLFATVLVVSDSAPVRAVLEDVYAGLDLRWDPSTAGGIADEVPGVTVADVEQAVLTAYGDPAEGEPDAETLALAAGFEERHRI